MKQMKTSLLGFGVGLVAAQTPSQQTILAKAYQHMPIFIMHPEEVFQPSNISVMYQVSGGGGGVERSKELSKLAISHRISFRPTPDIQNTNLADVNGNIQGSSLGFCQAADGCTNDYLFPFNKGDWATSVFDAPKTPDWARGVAVQNLDAVPLHIFFNVVNNGSRVDVYYHTIYPYNEGDIEFVAISYPIDASGSVEDPQTVCLGRHTQSDYGFYDWNTSQHIQKIGERPKAYIAVGGHGHWSKASCCNHHGPLGVLLDTTGEGPQWDASNATNLHFWCANGVCDYEGYLGVYGLPANSGYSNLEDSPPMPVVQLEGPGNKFEFCTPKL
ncbi:hypothetical protein BDK51DRAFT_27287 [Blyttiomyces helicus]|uniref:Uncharacterized protein n=1 Tax=Blyttiomyces helicus TaxID=388810 RepID=A0A4V1ISJ7_9FUNG|nr:hypothetical protein BDK51DRAFT_27287 [Blyttiomyces helicus]|eukprot:RKO93797.1 hypothetical protein BDK51DRAFT_27287 [Blyttiomyces helicus]